MARLRDLRRLVLASESIPSTLDRCDELGQVHLERVQDLVGVVLGAQADLAFARASILDDVLGSALGLLGDLLFGNQPLLALAGLLDDPLGLALGLGKHLLPFLDDPAGLLDLLWDRRPHLVEDVVDLFLVHAHLVRERNRLGVMDQIVTLVYEYQDVHGAPLFRQRLSRSFNALATSSGTMSSILPPNVASSFTPLDLTKLYLGDAIRYTDSTSGAW